MARLNRREWLIRVVAIMVAVAMLASVLLSLL